MRREAHRRGYDVHRGYVLAICADKLRVGAAIPPIQGPSRVPRKCNCGPAVFDGAKFQDLGNTPATLQSARAADFIGRLPGHVLEVANAEQAYVQVEMQRGLT